MRIHYKQRYGITLVSMMEETLVGLASIRPGDKYDRNLGFAVALVKAHSALPKREQRLADKLEDVPWKSIQIPEASMGIIMKTALQYRQAAGHTKEYVKLDWGDGDIEYELPFVTDARYLPRILVSQSGVPLCELAEAFGKRLIKQGAL